MKKTLTVLLAATASCALAFRPSAVPLVQVDPFFSVWSQADKLTDTETTHWSGAKQLMSATISVDGKDFRLLGATPSSIPALEQTGTTVTPLRTICTFKGEGVDVSLTFANPLMPENLDVFSRPVTYVTVDAKASDGKEHDFCFAFGIDGAMVRNNDKSAVKAEVASFDKLAAVKIGRTEQNPLAWSGDRCRPDWGYAWLAAPDATVRADGNDIALGFCAKGNAFSKHLLLAYDDIESIMFFNRRLKAWWARKGKSFEKMLSEAEADYPALQEKMIAFEKELTADLENVGGKKYAQIASLAFRHNFAACKLVADPNGQPLYFSKEQTSNGCIGTVDVFYPQSPVLALMSPTLLRATLAPILLYADSPAWPYDFAPHDVGQYPLANYQRYGFDNKTKSFLFEKQMPVEESGNMLICLAELAQIEGTAEFAGQWWPLVTKWAEYLAAKGFDPENQLCTDDFAGHLAHNANLSIKAIMGLACYSKLALMLGHTDVAQKYMELAKGMVPKWIEAAKGGAEGAYKLAFDQEGSWSMKYNLVWDRILGFNLFPLDIAKTEMAAYRKLQLPFGLPLDNRKTWTKGDWLVWTATLTQDRSDFEAIVDRYWKFIDETPDRLPLSDWYFADTSKIRSFLARPVIGGVFIPLLYNRDTWKKYAQRSNAKTLLYAPLALDDKQAAFNIASFNIRGPFDKGEIAWSNRMPRIKQVIKDRKFDLVGCQEVTPKQFASLNETMLPDFASVGRGRDKNGKGEGMYIYYRVSRFEMITNDTFQLSETPSVWGSKSWDTACERTCTWVKLRDKQTGVVFFHFNTHLDHISELARQKGMDLILEKMRELAQGHPVFLTGDMNTTDNGKPENAINVARKMLVDTGDITGTPHVGPKKTFHGWHDEPRAFIDYIFTDGTTKVISHETCTDKPGGNFASDHYPVVARVILGSEPQARTVETKIDLLQRIREGNYQTNIQPVGDVSSTIEENFTFDGNVLHILGKGIGYMQFGKPSQLPERGYLPSNDLFKNYRMIVEFKWGDKQWGKMQGKAFDNGLFFHVNGPLGVNGKTWPAAFEANIIEGGIGDILTLPGAGYNYSLNARAVSADEGQSIQYSPKAPYVELSKLYGRLNWQNRPANWQDKCGMEYTGLAENKHGEWNTMEVVCKDDTVAVYVNGRKVNEACNLTPASGAVAIQTEGSEVFVRRLELLPL